MQERLLGFKTLIVDQNLSVQDRLTNLREWYALWLQEDQHLEQRAHQLNQDKHIDVQKGAAIASLRRTERFQIVAEPLEISPDVLGQVSYAELREHFARQFARLSKKSRLLWLGNFLFIITPDLRRLQDKVIQVCSYQTMGQQRCFLIGGPSGMGKTTLLNWIVFCNRPTVESVSNYVPVVKVDAPTSNLTPRALLQRIVLACGNNYVRGNTEEDLLMKIALLFQKCSARLLIIDEIEHITQPKLRRRVLEISNITTGVPIVCASCTPLNWIEGDNEIAGRWNDYLELRPYTGKNLQSLLAFIELLLPFSQPSNLADYQIEVKDSRQRTKTKTLDGPAKLIEQKTGGILRDIMVLILSATYDAIECNEPNVSMSRLENTWRQLQDHPATNILQLIKKYQSDSMSED